MMIDLFGGQFLQTRPVPMESIILTSAVTSRTGALEWDFREN
ncbi:MAG: hypothetical protein OXG94_05900 [Bacteroidetes bacterium]|nr:hypothetical protein [Bacteroidota bacterium]